MAVLGPVVLPEAKFVQGAHSSRRGAHVRIVVVHRWGVRFSGMPAEARSYEGVINEFKDPKNEASAHWVYPGSAVAGGNEATQMVKRSDKAWTEELLNAVGISIESADAIWLGHDWHGFHVLARMVAFELHHGGMPAVWSKEHGFCRHGDLGVAGGDHPACPTTDIHLWRTFVSAVQHEHARGGFRPHWGVD